MAFGLQNAFKSLLEAVALLAEAEPVSRKFRARNFERQPPAKHAAVRSLNSHSKGFWRHGRR